MQYNKEASATKLKFLQLCSLYNHVRKIIP